MFKFLFKWFEKLVLTINHNKEEKSELYQQYIDENPERKKPWIDRKDKWQVICRMYHTGHPDRCDSFCTRIEDNIIVIQHVVEELEEPKRGMISGLND